MRGIFIIAHAPLASAFRECALHVFPENAAQVVALDVLPHLPPEETLAQARIMLAQLGAEQTLVLTDIFGATPCNIAQKLVEGTSARLLAGVNLPMLLRAICYRNESLDAMMARALAGGAQGVMQVTATAPQNQLFRKNDQNANDHQQ